MIVCPKCKHVEMEGALFCSECGNRMIDAEGAQTHRMAEPAAPAQEANHVRSAARRSEPGEAKTSLYILKTDKYLPLEGQQEFTIGRVAKGQSIHPDLDLSPYSAYEDGVSRIHAMIRVTRGSVGITDLSSVNGTYINDVRIPANQFRPVEEGDLISLGRFKIKIVIRE
jgi:pSer/pThr/pTyr-binding forkhead associated (FHA) protein